MTYASRNKVAVIGMGIMGIATADNLDKEGLLVATWNRSEKPGLPKFEPNIREAVNNADIILILVTDDEAVSDVLDQIEPVLTSGQIVIQCSTVSPASNISFDKRVTSTGAGFVEALIGGSKVAAIERQIIFYLGGRDKEIRAVMPVLDRISAKCIHVGEVGKASAVKLAMNLNIAMQVEALSESFAYAERAGIDPAIFFNVLRNNTAGNKLSEVKEPKLKEHDFSPQFSVKNMLKDIRLALATEATDNGLALLSATEKLYARAMESGYGDEDMIALYKLINND